MRSLDGLERTVTGVGFGLPLALLGAAVGFLVTMPLGSAVFWTPAVFLAVSAAAILAGFIVPTHALLSRALQIAIAVLLIALPLIRLAAGGPGWPTALAVGQPSIMAVDLAMLLGGGWMLWRLIGQRRKQLARPAPTLQPAE